MTDPPAARATIYDVADRAGVAISTVSRVLNGSPEVSDATRQRVQKAIEALRFQPQRTARSLAQQSTTSIAVAMPSATSSFYVEVLKGVKDALRERDIDLLLCNLGSQHPYATLERFLDRGAVDGLLLVSLPIEGEAGERLARMNAPVVLVGTRAGQDSSAPDFDTLWWDDAAGARRATEHLIGLGHRRIGLISAHAWSYNASPRLGGYRAALDAAGLPFDADLVVHGQAIKHAGYSEEAGAEAMASLLALEDPPTAVFAASDVQAFGAWAFARDAGLRVPRDMSIVGYDNLKVSRFLGLTTVDQQMKSVGQRATARLLARMAAPSMPAVFEEIDVPLVVRESTAGAPR
ncbi:MAG TPA: LacI family DNA-binding transcriptional regulator [Rubricoccaceae bacterium]|jgi:LacI family transcriptional regulator